jgi:hypothetical protein
MGMHWKREGDGYMELMTEKAEASFDRVSSGEDTPTS